MIKMSVYYPAGGGSKFDHDYYRNHHMPLIQERLGDACLRYEIDKGPLGSRTGEPARVRRGVPRLLAELGDIRAGTLSPLQGDSRGRCQLYGYPAHRADQRNPWAVGTAARQG